MTESAARQPAVVEWGPEPRRAWPERLGALAARRWRDPRMAWVLAGVGGLAVVGSLVGEWQLTTLPFQDGFAQSRQEAKVPVSAVGIWGAVWVAGAVAVGSCAALTLLGLPAVRPVARSIGLAVAGPLLAVLVAGSVELSRESVFYRLYGLTDSGAPDLEVSLGRGHYAAYAGLVLVAAAMWWAQPAARTAGTEPAGHGEGAATTARPRAAAPPDPGDGPADLTVTRAEPFSHLGDEHRWR